MMSETEKDPFSVKLASQLRTSVADVYHSVKSGPRYFFPVVLLFKLIIFRLRIAGHVIQENDPQKKMNEPDHFIKSAIHYLNQTIDGFPTKKPKPKARKRKSRKKKVRQGNSRILKIRKSKDLMTKNASAATLR